MKNNVSDHCLLALANDDMWIAVVVLICCESCAYSRSSIKRVLLRSPDSWILFFFLSWRSCFLVALGLLLIKSVQHARAMRNCAFTLFLLSVRPCAWLIIALTLSCKLRQLEALRRIYWSWWLETVGIAFTYLDRYDLLNGIVLSRYRVLRLYSRFVRPLVLLITD